ncbi:hypothetical protein I7I51_02629 [Histoplasma capsulatum]|uniref:Uncharacterized protein n=1 Tax=Ajellomyces capsulatus TaxID=5037 RepID=A0A8A1M8Q7_AJECA|nr:hypothetical protein I7I51_02629 [Histoplasma capsulatum]
MPTPPESRDRGCVAAGFEATGIYPLNPQRVLQGLRRPITPPESFKPTAIRTRTPTSLGSLRTAVYYFYQGNQALLQPIIRAGEALALEVEMYRIENQALAQHLHKQRTRQRQVSECPLKQDNWPGFQALEHEHEQSANESAPLSD